MAPHWASIKTVRTTEKAVLVEVVDPDSLALGVQAWFPKSALRLQTVECDGGTVYEADILLRSFSHEQERVARANGSRS